MQVPLHSAQPWPNVEKSVAVTVTSLLEKQKQQHPATTSQQNRLSDGRREQQTTSSTTSTTTCREERRIEPKAVQIEPKAASELKLENKT